VHYRKVTGFTGFLDVNYVYLPPVTIQEGQVAEIADSLKQLNRLFVVEYSRCEISQETLEKLQRLLPHIDFRKTRVSEDEESEIQVVGL
jgi:hypothetical protein